MNAVIIANGEIETHARLQEIWRRADLRIAADGGARNARLFLQHAPHVVIGDMDSVDDETREWLETNKCEFIQYPRAKDETDLELALLFAQERGADEITLLGALGGRADQFLANVMLLTQARNARIVDAASEIWVVGKEDKEGPQGTDDRQAEGNGRAEISGKQGDIVSLIPLADHVDGIVTHGLKYPLRGETLVRGDTRGISNVMLDERATVRATRGALLVVHLFG